MLYKGKAWPKPKTVLFGITAGDIYTFIICGFILGLLFMGLMWILGNAIDRNIDNSNINKCESAKISGNVEWSNKCQGYYDNGRYEYLRNM